VPETLPVAMQTVPLPSPQVTGSGTLGGGGSWVGSTTGGVGVAVGVGTGVEVTVAVGVGVGGGGRGGAVTPCAAKLAPRPAAIRANLAALVCEQPPVHSKSI
jgi:hypothetical protein